MALAPRISSRRYVRLIHRKGISERGDFVVCYFMSSSGNDYRRLLL